MTDQQVQGPGSAPPRYEKDEKGQEKQEEKGRGPDEKYEKNPVGFLIFAVVLFWVGVFFLLRNRHVFPETDRGMAVLLWGAAAIFFCELIIRLLMPRFRRPIIGTFVLVAVLAGVGVGLWTGGDWEIVGPIVLIAVALGLIGGRLLPRR